MPYTPGDFDSVHLYLQWGGKLPGNEQWSCGLRLAGPAGTAVADAITLIDDYKGAVQAYHTDNSTGIGTAAKLSFVKLNAIGVDGNYISEATNEIVLADIAGGGGAAAPYPNQVAMVVSLTTGFSRGPAHRGRYYLPLPVFALDGSGTIAAANAAVLSGTTDTFIGALNAATPGWKVNVFSRKSGAATHRPVTGNEIGRVYDTQRRRRRSLVEDYQ